MDFDPENPFQSDMDNSDPTIISWYFMSEDYFKPRRHFQIIPDFTNLRNRASGFFKLYAAYGARDPVIPYLAMIYFDLYTSVTIRGASNSHGLAMVANNCKSLFVTSCFIIAWKMRKPVFSLNEFWAHYNLPGHLRDEKEYSQTLLDRWLKYRHLEYIPMPYQNAKRPVTSFCFLDYLVDLTELSEDDGICLKNFATHKLYDLQYDIRYTVFKPSIVAAAAIAFCVVKYYYEVPIEDLLDACFDSGYFITDNLKLAIEMTIPGFTVEFGILLSSDDDDDDSESSATLDRVRLLQEEKQQQTALSSSLDTADRSPGACTSPAQPILSASDCSPRLCKALARMATADRSQGARADNRIDIEMLPPRNRIPTRLGLTPSKLPTRLGLTPSKLPTRLGLTPFKLSNK